VEQHLETIYRIDSATSWTVLAGPASNFWAALAALPAKEKQTSMSYR